MVIARQAIEDYLHRDLRDSARAKLFTDEALDRKIAALDPVPRFHTPPRKAQKVGFLLAMKHKGYQFNYDMGLGKSKMMLDVFRQARRIAFRQGAQRYKMVVLVPASSNVGQWVHEVKVHAPSLSSVGIEMSGSTERRLAIFGEVDIVIITYAGFLGLVCTGKVVKDENGEPAKDEHGNVKTKGWQLDKKLLKRWQDEFDMFVGDESTHYRGHQTLMARAVRKLAWACDRRYGLTGTPYGKNPEDVWGQMYVVDKGDTLGPTVGLWRAAFCNKKDNYWSGGVDYTFNTKMAGTLARILRHGSLRYEITECEDLPARNYVTVPVKFDEETWQYYDKLVEDIRASGGAFEVVESAFLRMRALTAGYLPVKDAEGDRQVIRFKKAPKIEAFIDWLGQLPPHEKVVVFHEYRLTGEVLCEALKKAKVRHNWLYSGTKGGKSKVVDQFLTDPKVRVLVSSSAGAFGGNWQKARYTAFIESPVNPIYRNQEERRTWRMGQDRTCFYFDFVVEDSIDESILKSVRKGENLFKQIIENRRILPRRGGGPALTSSGSDRKVIRSRLR